MNLRPAFFFFFFNDTATTEIYTLSLHDALPISLISEIGEFFVTNPFAPIANARDRKSTRLNSSHITISYAVFCLKKKKTLEKTQTEHTIRMKRQEINKHLFPH